MATDNLARLKENSLKSYSSSGAPTSTSASTES